MSTAGLTEELRLVEEDLTRLQKTAADLRRPKPAILAVIGPDGAVHAGPDALRCLAGIVGPAALSWRTAPALAYGVKAVANDLTVTPPVSPEKVQAVIEDAFRREAEVDARHIRVEVSDHTAKLYGHVHSVHEAAAARAAAAAARWWPRWRATCWSLRNHAGWSRRSSVTPVPASQGVDHGSDAVRPSR